MNPHTIEDIATASAAYANRRAWPTPKRAASRYGRTRRTGYRWFDEKAAKGSPAHKVARHVLKSDEPFMMLAYAKAAAVRKEIIEDRVTRAKLIERIIQHRRTIAILEGQEEGSFYGLNLGHMRRSDLSLRIAGEWEHLGALWEAAGWQDPPITREEVFGRPA